MPERLLQVRLRVPGVLLGPHAAHVLPLLLLRQRHGRPGLLRRQEAGRRRGRLNTIPSNFSIVSNQFYLALYTG